MTDQPLPTFGQHTTTPVDIDATERTAHYQQLGDQSNLMRPAAPIFVPRPSPTSTTRAFDIFAAERHAGEEHSQRTITKPPLPDINDIKVQKDIERGPFGLPKSMIKKIPEQDKLDVTEHEQKLGEREGEQPLALVDHGKGKEDIHNAPTANIDTETMPFALPHLSILRSQLSRMLGLIYQSRSRHSNLHSPQYPRTVQCTYQQHFHYIRHSCTHYSRNHLQSKRQEQTLG